MATRIVQRYQSEGYQIAVNDFQFNTRYFSMMDYVDYIKLNISGNTEAWLENMVQMAHSMHKKCVATGIDSKELYDLAHRVGADYFQGSYVAGRVKTKVHKANYLQSNFFQLVVEVTKDEPDIDQIEGLISRDASLTYALLRMANFGILCFPYPCVFGSTGAGYGRSGTDEAVGLFDVLLAAG